MGDISQRPSRHGKSKRGPFPSFSSLCLPPSLPLPSSSPLHPHAPSSLHSALLPPFSPASLFRSFSCLLPSSFPVFFFFFLRKEILIILDESNRIVGDDSLLTVAHFPETNTVLKLNNDITKYWVWSFNIIRIIRSFQIFQRRNLSQEQNLFISGGHLSAFLKLNKQCICCHIIQQSHFWAYTQTKL